MNAFDKKFFSKYINEGQKIHLIVHKHIIEIIAKIFLWLIVALGISFLYYYSIALQTRIPFMFIKYSLLGLYIIIIYQIFDWYADVWIVSNEGITDLRWSLLRSNMNNVLFQNIEGLGVDIHGLKDKLLQSGNITLHKVGSDTFVLKNVYRPYRYVEQIEEISNAIQNFDPGAINDVKFNMIVDTLGGMMEEYLKKNELPKNKKYNPEKIAYTKSQEGTIDLR